MPKYEVQVDAYATIYVEVEADDEDGAHDEAITEAKAAMDSEWEIDTMHGLTVMQTTELKSDA